MIMAVSGVYLIVGAGSVESPLGVVVSLAAVLGWSLCSVLSRKGIGPYDTLEVTKDALGIAVVCSGVFSMIEYLCLRPSITVTLPTLAGLLYMGIFCTGVTYILWNRSLSRLPAANCSAFYPIQPLTSALLGALFFHEKIGLSFAAGAVCITAGILLSLFPSKKSDTVSES